MGKLLVVGDDPVGRIHERLCGLFERFKPGPAHTPAQLSESERTTAMTRTTMRRLCLALSMAGAAFAFTAMPAIAASAPASGTGLTGACNMLLDESMTTVPMVKNTLNGQGANGDTGMFGAVAASGCG
jgi:hypothetical protein